MSALATLGATLGAAPATPTPVGTGGPAALPDVEGGYASTQVLVRLQPGVTAKRGADGRWRLLLNGRSVGRDTERSLAILAQAKATGAVQLFPNLSNQALASELGLDRAWRIDVPAGTNTPALAAALNGLATLVEFAELDGIGGLADLPDDPDFGLQYDMHNTGQVIAGVPGVVDADVDAPEGWDLPLSASHLTVAILDSGINLHVELAGRILPGLNIPDGTVITTDECSSHGTHVSGILAAQRGNATGIAGIAGDALLKPYVVVNGCTGFESWVATAILDATEGGIRLINMSLQYSTGSETFHDAVLYAAGHDVIMVAATGNGSGGVSYPAKWEETIAVASVNNLDVKAATSNSGPEVDLCAGGENVHSLIGMWAYGLKSGTSMAAPHVTGAATLMLAKNATLSAAEVRAILVSTAVDVAAPGFDNDTGHGRINLAAALAATPGSSSPDLDGDGVLGPGDLAILLGAWGACADCEVGCPADLSGDCTVDAADLALLLGAWTA